MSEVGVSAQGKLTAAFTAVQPHKQLAAAEAFLSTLRDMSQSGAKPSADTLSSGQKLLQDLEHKHEDYLYRSAILAGQEAGSNRELDSKVQTITKEAEHVERTTRKLRSVLHAFA